MFRAAISALFMWAPNLRKNLLHTELFLMYPFPKCRAPIDVDILVILCCIIVGKAHMPYFVCRRHAVNARHS